MKKLIAALVVALVLVSLGAVAYKMGWLATLGLGGSSPAATSGGAAQRQARRVSRRPADRTPERPRRAAAAPAGSPGGDDLRTPIPAPKFDGNVASIDFGGTVESTTESYGDTADHSYIIDGNPETAWRNGGSSHGIGEIVFSFFARDVVLVDAVILQGSSESSDSSPAMSRSTSPPPPRLRDRSRRRLPSRSRRPARAPCRSARSKPAS